MNEQPATDSGRQLGAFDIGCVVIGGIIGIILGLVGTQVIAHFAEIPFVFSTAAIVGAVLFSGSVGIFFGFYPARKASNLDPIASLRYE